MASRVAMRRGAGGFGEVVAARGVEDRPRRADDQAGAAVRSTPARTDAARSPPWAPTPGTRIGRSPTMRPHRGELLGVRRPDDEPALAELRPPLGDHRARPAGTAARPPTSRSCRSPLPGLLVRHRASTPPRSRNGVGGVGAEVRVDGHGVGAVAVERLAGVVLGRRADVAALGVEHEHDVGVALADVAADRFQLRLGPLRGEVGDLRLERAHEVGGGVDDRACRTARWRRRRRRAAPGTAPDPGRARRTASTPTTPRPWRAGRGSPSARRHSSTRDRAGRAELARPRAPRRAAPRGGSSWRTYRKPSLRTSNTSGQTCMQLPGRGADVVVDDHFHVGSDLGGHEPLAAR